MHKLIAEELYQNVHFAKLLKVRPADALQFRADTIKMGANKYARELEAAKVSSLAVGAMGLAPLALGLATTPFAAAVGGVALAGYGIATVFDALHVKRFYPFPLIRQSLNEIAGGFAGNDHAARGSAPLECVTEFVSPELASEYTLLYHCMVTLCGKLENLLPEQRLTTYRYAVRTFHLHGNIEALIASGNVETIANNAVRPEQRVQLPQREQRPIDRLMAIANTMPQPAEEPAPLQYAAPVMDDPWGVDEPEVGPTVESFAEEMAAAPPLPPVQPSSDLPAEWMRYLLEYPAVLLYGAQGSGKSTLARWLMNERKKRGHLIDICDPHFEFGDWPGFDVYGKGLNYFEVNERLVKWADETVKRYQQRATVENVQFQPYTLLAEEFTRWAGNCSNSSMFFEKAMTDIRKIGMCCVFVSHNDTLSTLGGAKGYGKTKDETLLKVHLQSKASPTEFGKMIPTGRAFIKLPGQPEIQEVSVPNLK